MIYCLDKLRTKKKKPLTSCTVILPRFEWGVSLKRKTKNVAAVWEYPLGKKGLGNRLVYHNHHSNPRWRCACQDQWGFLSVQVKSLFSSVLIAVAARFIAKWKWRGLLINLLSNLSLENFRNTSICNSKLIAVCHRASAINSHHWTVYRVSRCTILLISE
jgi:hypothetical protein